VAELGIAQDLAQLALDPVKKLLNALAQAFIFARQCVR
jgi:hypothetical protein